MRKFLNPRETTIYLIKVNQLYTHANCTKVFSLSLINYLAAVINIHGFNTPPHKKPTCF